MAIRYVRRDHDNPADYTNRQSRQPRQRSLLAIKRLAARGCDRIDTMLDGSFRIIDYKSSAQHLSYSKGLPRRRCNCRFMKKPGDRLDRVLNLSGACAQR